ncbi:MAG: hypothetical protein AAFX99_29530 [Myxococcota bacterium]
MQRPWVDFSVVAKPLGLGRILSAADKQTILPHWNTSAAAVETILHRWIVSTATVESMQRSWVVSSAVAKPLGPG